MLRLPDSWVWDFWFADTGEAYHVFFLRASRALKDPHRRHRRAVRLDPETRAFRPCQAPPPGRLAP